MEEAGLMGFSGGFEQGKPDAALPELRSQIPVNAKRVNPQNRFYCDREAGIQYDTNKIAELAFYYCHWRNVLESGPFFRRRDDGAF